jgi:hypothetical protein
VDRCFSRVQNTAKAVYIITDKKALAQCSSIPIAWAPVSLYMLLASSNKKSSLPSDGSQIPFMLMPI